MGIRHFRHRDPSHLPASLLLVRIQPEQGHQAGTPRAQEERPNLRAVSSPLLLGIRYHLPDPHIGRFHPLPPTLQHRYEPKVWLERPSHHLLHRRRHCSPWPCRCLGEVLGPRQVLALATS